MAPAIFIWEFITFVCVDIEVTFELTANVLVFCFRRWTSCLAKTLHASLLPILAIFLISNSSCFSCFSKAARSLMMALWVPRSSRFCSFMTSSTVFFLKREAMVSGRARAAQLGPVRSGPVLGTGPVEGRIPEKPGSGGRRRTGSPSSTCGGRGSARLPRTRPGCSGDRELRHFFGEVTSRRRVRSLRARLRTAPLKPQRCPHFKGCPLFPAFRCDPSGPRLARLAARESARCSLGFCATSGKSETWSTPSLLFQVVGIRDPGDVWWTADLRLIDSRTPKRSMQRP